MLTLPRHAHPKTALAGILLAAAAMAGERPLAMPAPPDCPPIQASKPWPSSSAPSKARQDRLFKLAYTQTPAFRAVSKQAAQTRIKLQALLAATPSDDAQIYAVAEMHAQALMRLHLMRIEFNARGHAFPISEQTRRPYAERATPAACQPLQFE